jgi:toxin YoeB
MMRICFTDHAWDEYLYWASRDRQMLKRIHVLIQDIQRSPFDGIGKPEPLKHGLSGFWSRRIDDEQRLVCCLRDDDLVIVQCRYHY